MTKYELLSFLQAHGNAVGEDISRAFELSIPATGMALLRLTRQSLAVRHFDPDSGCYWYELTTSGLRRLRYYNNSH